MSDAEKNQDGQHTDAEIVDQQDAKVVNVPSGDGEVEIEVQAGKTTVAPTEDADSE
jgi:hypothetical protein